MAGMKKILLCLYGAVTVSVLCCWRADAAPRATSNRTRDYVIGTQGLEGWSCGIFGRYQEREVEVGERDYPDTLENTRGMVYVGYDLLSWATPYVAVGLGQSDFNSGLDSDEKMAYGGGVSIHLMDVLIPDPALMEDRFRIEANAQYIQNEAEVLEETIEWGEFYASLTVGIVNDLEGNTLFHPKSIGIFAGPAISQFIGSDLDHQDSGDRIGFTAGMEIFLTDSISVYGSAEVFENAGVGAGLHMRF